VIGGTAVVRAEDLRWDAETMAATGCPEAAPRRRASLTRVIEQVESPCLISGEAIIG